MAEDINCAETAKRKIMNCSQHLEAILAEMKATLDEHAIVTITDARGKIIYANEEFCAISQYSREELLGQDHRVTNSGYHCKEFIRDLWMTITSGQPWRGEMKNRAKDGSHYWVATTLVPLLDAQGEPCKYIAIRADITEDKRMEAALLERGEQKATRFPHRKQPDNPDTKTTNQRLG